jgi:soluble lytic murein transglycosylase
MSRRRKGPVARVGSWLTLLLTVAAVGSAAFVYRRWCYREQRYNRLIEQTAARHGLDKFLIKAVMRQESGFDPFAYSSKGAIGLMQVMPGTGDQWARATGQRQFAQGQLWREAVNIEVGAWYLANSWRRWQAADDPLPFVLAEYNAGPGAVQRWLPRGAQTTAAEFKHAITYPGVRRYVDTITDLYETYRANGKL